MSVVVVVGASRGIGLNLVKKLAEGAPKLSFLPEGFKIVATARNPAGTPALTGAASASKGRVDVLQLDINNEASTDAFVTALNQKYGKVDMAIFSAGVFGGRSRIQKLAKPDVVDTLMTNAYSPVSLAGKMLPLLKASKDARAVFLSAKLSSAGLLTDGKAPAYRTSKAALNMLVRCLAKEEPSVSFMLIHPGWVQTDMGGKSAPVTPEDSAAGILATADKYCVKEHSADALYTYEGDKLPW